MSAIILPPGYTYEDRTRLEAEAIVEMSLQQRYEQSAIFALIADQIHESHLGVGGAGMCPPCQAAAHRRLTKPWRSQHQKPTPDST